MDRLRGHFRFINRRNADTSNDYNDRDDLIDMSEPFSWQAPSPVSTLSGFRFNTLFSDEQQSNVQRLSSLLPPAPTSFIGDQISQSAGNVDQANMTTHVVAFRPRLTTQSFGQHVTDTQNSSSTGYMQRASPFSLDSPVQDETVKDEHAQDDDTDQWPDYKNVTISYAKDDGNAAIISGINLDFIEDKCPLLALAIEYSKTGPKLHLEALSDSTADPFGRFLSSGSYALDTSDGDIFESVPTSVLLHCQLYRLGALYDLTDLMSQASVNIIRQCEFGCSSPDKPIDLCEAILYAYENLRDHSHVIDTLINYCVSCFLQHHLDEDFEFQQLAYNLRPFHQDLCRNSMNRGFENETASAIIQMPFKPYVPETYASREDIDGNAYTDTVHHFHGGDDDDEAPTKKRKRWPMKISLPMRLFPPGQSTAEAAGETMSEDHGGVSSTFKADVDDASEAYASRKRRASSVVQPANTSYTDSEPEYEMIAGPVRVEELSSDSDSDAITVASWKLVETEPRSHATRPEATAASSSTTKLIDRNDSPDSSSDSEWSLV